MTSSSFIKKLGTFNKKQCGNSQYLSLKKERFNFSNPICGRESQY